MYFKPWNWNKLRASFSPLQIDKIISIYVSNSKFYVDVSLRTAGGRIESDSRQEMAFF